MSRDKSSTGASKDLERTALTLLHQIELHQSGWWDKSLQSILEGALALTQSPRTVQQLHAALRRDIGIRTSKERVTAALQSLQEEGSVITTSDGLFSLSMDRREAVRRSLEDAATIDTNARFVFLAALEGTPVPEAARHGLWDLFVEQFVMPLVRELGAATYMMISRKRDVLDPVDRHISHYMSALPGEWQSTAHAAAEAFVRSDVDSVRHYWLRHLNYFFLLDAQSMPEEALSSLSRRADSAPSFRFILDTNVLFSILDLHDNPADEVIEEFIELLPELRASIDVQLLVTQMTIDEARRVLAAAAAELSRVRFSANLERVITSSDGLGLTGIGLRFVRSVRDHGTQLTAHDYFEPYIDQLPRICMDKGIEILPESEARLLRDGRVAGDLAQLSLEDKSREALEHDVVLWWMAADLRGDVENISDVKYWITTIDFAMIRFDQRKRRGGSRLLPVCIHPSGMLHMLQLWVPRSREFELALVRSLMPFLAPRFDSDTERVTLKILQTMSLYESMEDLSERVITRVLTNKQLRTQIANSAKWHREEAMEAVGTTLESALQRELRDVEQEEAKVSQLLEGEQSRRRHLEGQVEQQSDDLEKLRLRLEDEATRSRELGAC